MSHKDRILIVDDENGICRFLKAVLGVNNYDVIVAQTGADAYMMITSSMPDLVLLDLGLPDMDGLQIIKTVREWTELPIIVVSALTHERDKVEALDAGADDYVTKPFSSSELLARIRTSIRRSKTQGSSPEIAQTGNYRVGGLTIDYDKHRVLIAGENAHLTRNEFKILALLGRNAGKVLTYAHIMKEIWGGAGLMGDNRILRVNMANIRRKIGENPTEPKYIFTEIGVGYWLREADQERQAAFAHQLLKSKLPYLPSRFPPFIHRSTLASFSPPLGRSASSSSVTAPLTKIMIA
jgi:two-component system KDP operon response regulator KdpE